MNLLLENWRTTTLGAIAIIVTVGFVAGTVSEHVFLIVLGTVIGGVATLAQDGKATTTRG